MAAANDDLPRLAMNNDIEGVMSALARGADIDLKDKNVWVQ